MLYVHERVFSVIASVWITFLPFVRYNHAWPSWLYIGPIVAFAVCYNLPKFFELSAIVDEGETYRLAFLVRK